MHSTPDPSRVRFTGPLTPFVSGLAEELALLGYTATSATVQMQLAAHLSRWLESQSMGPGGLTGPVIERFLVQRRGSYTNHYSLQALGPVLGYRRHQLHCGRHLAIDGPTGAVVDLKYPRDSRTGLSPDTMTWGELLRDFLRVALVPAHDRWVAQVISARLQRYVSDAAHRHGVRWAQTAGDSITLERAALQGLPRTAHGALKDVAWALPVVARCVTAAPIKPDLALYAYEVAAPGHGVAPEELRWSGRPVQQSAPRKPPSPAADPRQGTRARTSILQAITAITDRTGDEVVTVAAVLEELHRAGSRYADSTIRTMMTSHMCVDAQGLGIGTYDDLERVGRGEYRVRRK